MFGGLNFLKNSSLFNNVFNFAENMMSIRFASKKGKSNTRNRGGNRRPKHRRIHYQDGKFVQKGTLLVTQNKLRFHPGLNVGFGRNGTLFALESGQVMVTCEKIDPNLSHGWITKFYAGRNLENIYKKYFHVIPPPQHCRFKLQED